MIARRGALDGVGRLRVVGVQHSRRGTLRRARPSGFWRPGAWACAWWAGAHLGLGRELEGRLDLDEHALGDAELERVLERQVVLRMEARAAGELVAWLFLRERQGGCDPWGGREGLEGDTRRAVQEWEGCEGTPGRGGDR